jgi:ParB family transcriptional regulator, chromosome partitioning protein
VTEVQTIKLEFPTNEQSTITELPLSELQLGQYQPSLTASCKTIPAMIYQLSDKDAMELALKNLQRKDLNEIEELEAVLGLLALLLEFSESDVVKLLYRMDNEQKGKVTKRELGNQKAQIVETLFQRLGRMTWGSFIAMRLPLLKLQDDLKELLRAAEITPAHARLLMRIKNQAERQSWLKQIISQSLSAKQLLTQMRPNQKQHKHSAEITDLIARAGYLRSSFQKQNWQDSKKFFKAKKLIDSLEALLNTEGSNQTV